MTDRLAAAVTELVAALREDLARLVQPATAPDSVDLLSPAAFARRSGLGRSTVYLAIADGSVRSIKVRGRRLLPSSELARLAAAAPGAVPRGNTKRPLRSMRSVRTGQRTEGNFDAHPTAIEAKRGR
jgi:hypothetical protein